MNIDDAKPESKRKLRILTIDERLCQVNKTESIRNTAGGIAHYCNNIPGAMIGYTHPLEAIV